MSRVIEVPIKFKTSDNLEFDDKQDAERHEAVLLTKREFDSAQRELERCLAGTAKTADGKPFKFGSRDYYYVNRDYAGAPIVEEVAFLGYGFHVRGEFDNVILSVRMGNGSFKECRVSELYAVHAMAERALLEALERYAERIAERIGRLRIKLESKGR